MSSLREEIRAILREELSALRANPPAQTVVEHVRISSDSDLNRFVRELIARMEDAGFAGRISSGLMRFELIRAEPVVEPHIVASAPRPAGADIDKALITERDIAALGEGPRALRLREHARLTPLARDEARRRGIRIERMKG